MSALTHAASGTIRTSEPARPAAPLGALLVSRGFLAEDDLSEALAEQGRTPRPLGAILVSRGLVSPEVVAQALATQHGSILKTEYGFATGFDARIAAEEVPAEVPVSPAPVGLGTPLRLAGGAQESEPAAPEPSRPPSGPPVAISRSDALELELATVAGENEKLRARLGELQLEAMRLRTECDARRNEAAVVGARIAGLEAGVAALYAERDQLRARVDELQRLR